MQTESRFPATGLLGCGRGYGRTIAGLFASVLGDRLYLTNRHAEIVSFLKPEFPNATTDNRLVVRTCRWIGILTRPDQVPALLDEIGDDLSDEHVILNLTARRWSSDVPKIDIAMCPPVEGKTAASFVAPDAAVSAADRTQVISLLEQISGAVFEVDDCLEQMTLMARAIAHLCALLEHIQGEGHDPVHIATHLESVAVRLRSLGIENVVAEASTGGGMTGQIYRWLNESDAFQSVIAAEKGIIDDFKRR